MELYVNDGLAVIDYLKSQNKKVFLDLKFHDIPITVSKTIKSLNSFNLDFISVHVYRDILMAAVQSSQTNNILGVSVLTSMNAASLKREGLASLKDLLMLRYKNAIKSQCRGLICSANDLKLFPSSALTYVTPEISNNKNST